MSSYKFQVRYSIIMVLMSVILSCVFAVVYTNVENAKWCSLLDALEVPVAPLQDQANGQPPSPNTIATHDRAVAIQMEISKLHGSFC